MNATSHIVPGATPQAPAPVVPVKGEPRLRVNGKVTMSGTVKILVVDDRADKLLALEAILAPLGQTIVKARSGKEALRHLLREDFAVILLDVAMPGMDGFETAAMIRKRPKSEHVPIIFVTSLNTSESNVFEGYSLGAVDYIITPVIPDVLRTKVSVFVELHKKSELIRQQAEQLRRLEEARHRREIAEFTDRLEAETKRNRFFTLSLDLLAVGNFEDSLLQLNSAWEHVLGFTGDEIKARPLLEIVHPEDRVCVGNELNRLKRETAPAHFESRCRCRDGSFRWLSWTVVPFASEQLLYVFAHDITLRRSAESQVKMLNEELARRVNDLTDVNKELEAFCYSISHDLRAPLRSISGFTQVVRGHAGLGATEQDYLRRVENAAKYMDTLLMDLLDYSRLSRSEMELIPVDLECAASDVLTSIEQEIRSRNAQVEIQRPLGAVVGHPATVRQILYNLIANGLKFVRDGELPRIRIWAEPHATCVRIWITDSGIGIAPQYHQKIFGLFQRLHSHDAYPGTGVGLAMVRKGLERMGGRIGVESELGKGSRFWFELRAAEVLPC